MLRILHLDRILVIPLVLVGCTVARCSASILTNVTISSSALAHAESWVFNSGQGAFVPVVPITDVVLPANTSGIVDTGYGTSASAQFDIDAQASSLVGNFSTKGLHGGGATYIALDMYQFYDNFYAQSNFLCDFDLTSDATFRYSVDKQPGDIFVVSSSNFSTGIGFGVGLNTGEILFPAGHYNIGLVLGRSSLGQQGGSRYALPDSSAVFSISVPEPSTLSMLIVSGFWSCKRSPRSRRR